MNVKEFYKEMYGDQAKNKSKLPYLYRKLRRFELNRYDLAYQLAPGGDSFLDMGCGNGELLLRLKDKYRQLWGVDILEPRLNQTIKEHEGVSSIHVVIADLNEQLSFKDSSFDTITAISVLEHIFDPYHLMKESHRLLKAKGTLIVQVPNVAWLPRRLQLLFGKLPITSNAAGWDGGHLHYFTGASLRRLFEKEGFRIVKVTHGGIFARLRGVWGSLLGADIAIAGIKE